MQGYGLSDSEKELLQMSAKAKIPRTINNPQQRKPICDCGHAKGRHVAALRNYAVLPRQNVLGVATEA